jgi:hypothetical protein
VKLRNLRATCSSKKNCTRSARLITLTAKLLLSLLRPFVSTAMLYPLSPRSRPATLSQGRDAQSKTAANQALASPRHKGRGYLMRDASSRSFTNSDSGWNWQELLKFTIHIAQYRPLAGSSYIKPNMLLSTFKIYTMIFVFNGLYCL